MSIKPSSAPEIRTLIASLGAGDEIKREASVARLAVIGGRAVDRLVAAYEDSGTSRASRVAILRVLEAIADPRALPLARKALEQGGDLAVTAAATLRALLDSPDAAAASESLDALVSTALLRGGEHRVRMAAFDALQEMPVDVRERLADAVKTDPDTVIAARANSLPTEAAAAEALWQDATEGRLPDDPAALRDAAQARAGSAPLAAVQRVIDAVRARESEGGGAAEWMAVRGGLHQALALRGSRVALYDLRETLAMARLAMPSTFLTTLHVIGDESCLDAIAAAFTHAGADERWRLQLAAAFQAIAKREKITRGSPVIKRIAARWPDAAGPVSRTSRTTPRQTTRGRT